MTFHLYLPTGAPDGITAEGYRTYAMVRVSGTAATLAEFEARASGVVKPQVLAAPHKRGARWVFVGPQGGHGERVVGERLVGRRRVAA